MSVTRYQYYSDNRLIRAETPNGTTQYRYGALEPAQLHLTKLKN
ncbi:hypothetical protein [Methylomonas sp. TEB]